MKISLCFVKVFESLKVCRITLTIDFLLHPPQFVQTVTIFYGFLKLSVDPKCFFFGPCKTPSRAEIFYYVKILHELISIDFLDLYSLFKVILNVVF